MYRGSALLSAAPSGSVDLIIKSKIQAEIRFYFTVIKIHNPTDLLPSYVYFSLYLSTDSLYIKFVVVTWEPHIAAMTVLVELQKVFYILYFYVFIFSVSATFFSGPRDPTGSGPVHCRDLPITLRHHTGQDSSGRLISPVQRPLP